MSEPTASEERERIAEYLEVRAQKSYEFSSWLFQHGDEARGRVLGANAEGFELIAEEIRDGAHREETR